MISSATDLLNGCNLISSAQIEVGRCYLLTYTQAPYSKSSPPYIYVFFIEQRRPECIRGYGETTYLECTGSWVIYHFENDNSVKLVTGCTRTGSLAIFPDHILYEIPDDVLAMHVLCGHALPRMKGDYSVLT